MNKIEQNVEEESQEIHLEEQDKVLENDKKNMLVSASAGSGKTYIMIKYICELVVKRHVPISDFLVLTFTKSAAAQMKEKLLGRLKEEFEKKKEEFITDQIDALSTANICTIDSFCERTIKKYASILGISESFSVLDESQSKSLKQDAFQRALKTFADENLFEFDLLMSAYKNSNEKLWEIVKNLEEISNSVADRDEFLKTAGENFEEKFDAASEFLFSHIKNAIQQDLEGIRALHLDDYADALEKLLGGVLSGENLFELFDGVKDIKRLPNRPNQKTIGQEIFEKVGTFRGDISDKVTALKSLNLQDAENVSMQKCGALEKAALKLFDLFEKQYNLLKKAQNCMDFADLEKYMRILSQQEQLFGSFQFVFVDEYQDTNKLQEEIIKNVAKNCNFVAVGDLKQGIYGFRLASSEIFLKDLKDFEADENSAVNYLKSNFRSSQKVLDFVNSIFQVCMTTETANVDYFSTSMLKGRTPFLDEEAKAINIDLVMKNSPEYDEIPAVYSVKNAKMSVDNSNLNMLQDIKRRILEVVGSKISDDKQLRQANFGDIAILARGRDSLFEQLETFLQENDIPVISNSRAKLLQEPEIQMLVNYLRLSLAVDDEVALLSVLLSGLYLLDIQKIFDEKHASGQNLLTLVLENKSGAYTKFLADLQEFRTNTTLYGAKEAFLALFSSTNYFSYLNLRKGKEKLFMFVEKFLSEVEKQKFDIPALIHFFETVEIVVTPEASSFGDCVTLTTIHDSKGLEYPIVFLIGCDDSFLGKNGGDVQINENFGLALKVYDLENNDVVPSVRLLAISEQERQKDFVEELMIFYVALTRAKNRLYLFGNFDEKSFSKHDVKSCHSYFDLIFLALDDVKKNFVGKDHYETETMEVNLIEEVEEILPKTQRESQEAQFAPEIAEEIEKYVDFSYKFGRAQNFRLKESVTGLTKRLDENNLEKFSNENFRFAENAIDVGNAYHLALKLLDFDKIFDKQTLDKELEKFQNEIDLNLINKDILLKNILILKNLTQNATKIFKEKEFLLKDKISRLIDEDVEEQILVQGVVDLFVVKKDQFVLVDYKYSSGSEEYLIKKYKNQLKLYKIAIEEAFNLPVTSTYLLSLKHAKLISINL